MIASVGQSSEPFSYAEIEPARQFNVGTFLEGIVFDGKGYGYVSAVREGAIHRFQPGESPVHWAESASPNGHKILPDGSHAVTDRTEPGIVRFNASGERQGVLTGSDGVNLKAPNDIALDGHGGYYFTDMRDSFRGEPNGEVHHVDKLGQSRIVATKLSAPNGLVLSPDGKALYVSESSHWTAKLLRGCF
jgi:sugar lactone lactonase YvrE